MNYEIFSTSVQGSSHIQKAIPCQDYVLCIAGENGTVFACADGHSDPRCMRSERGSRFAAEEACAVLNKALERGITENDAGWLWKQILDCWHQRIKEDLEKEPLKEDEQMKCADYLKGHRLERVYGTTLICGAVTDSSVLILKRGDGTAAVMDLNGRFLEPIVEDERCILGRTTSLCDTDAEACSSWYRVFRNGIGGVFSATDGYRNSFESADLMYASLREMVLEACTGTAETMTASLPEYLTGLSRLGSHDDISLTGIFRSSLSEEALERFRAENKNAEIRHELLCCKEKYESMSGRYRYLREQYTEHELRYQRLKQELFALECEKEMVTQDTDTDRIMKELAAEISTEHSAHEWIRILESAISDLRRSRALEYRMTRVEEKIRGTEEEIRKELEYTSGEFLAYHRKYEAVAERIKTLKEELADAGKRSTVHETETLLHGPETDETGLRHAAGM